MIEQLAGFWIHRTKIRKDLESQGQEAHVESGRTVEQLGVLTNAGIVLELLRIQHGLKGFVDMEALAA